MRSIEKAKLSLIIPCYNEEANIKLLFDECIKELSKHEYSLEFVFINDGSTDKTMEELKKILKNDEGEIRIINFSRNFGKEAAMYAGLKNATGKYISIIDADLQQSPSLVNDMYEVLNKNNEYDAVCCYQSNRIEGKFISFLKKKFYQIIRKMTGIDFKEGASDFRLFRRYVVDAILSLSENNRFSKGIFGWIGFNTYYIPYTPNKRINGKSSFGLKNSFKYALTGILSFSVTPLRFATYLGSIISIISFICLIVAIIKKIFIGVNVPGYTTLLVCILFLGGMILLSLGIIGEYLARAYMEIKNRPIYLEKENISNKEDSPL